LMVSGALTISAPVLGNRDTAIIPICGIAPISCISRLRSRKPARISDWKSATRILG
jgi:hypothetical protein